MIYIYSNRPSNGAASLARRMGVRRIKRQGSAYRGKEQDVVINWGGTERQDWMGSVRVLNHPYALAGVIDKLQFFGQVKGKISIPPYTTDKKEAAAWGRDVVVRHLLRASEARGVEVVKKGGTLPNAPLYVQYIPKIDEYRVHFIDDRIIHVQRKARRLDVPDKDVNWQIRNHDNGFIYTFQDVVPPKKVIQEAEKLISLALIDFGAIDIIWNKERKTAYVLEVNTAPGLEGTTLEIYSENFQSFLSQS